MFFGGKKSELDQSLHVAICISTDYVIAALFTYQISKDSEEKITLLAAVRDDELLRKNANVENASTVVVKSINTVTDKLIHKELPRVASSGIYRGSSKITKVHYIMATPWAISQSKTIEINYDTPVRITNDIVSDILIREQDILQKELFENNSDYTPKTLCFEQKVIDIRCNGYSTLNVHNVIAKSIQISFAMSVASATIVENIRKTVHKYLHPHEEEFHSAVLAEYYALRDGTNSASEALFLRLLGESTDVVLVKHGIPAHIASFGYGTHTLVRKLSMTVDSDSFEAVNIWKGYLIKTISDMGISTDMPQNFYVSGEAAFLDKCLPAIKDAYPDSVAVAADYSHIESNIVFADTNSQAGFIDDRTLSLIYSIGKLTK